MKNFLRLPNTTDRSLRAWSAVDEYILSYVKEENYDLENISIIHDRFGYMTCHLVGHHPNTITYLESQRKAIVNNALTNSISIDALNLLTVLDDITSIGITALMKVPKSQDLFRLYLIKIAAALPSEGILIAGFMTRHFAKSILEIAGEYFGSVEQTKAWKKSRLLILSKPKKDSQVQVNILKSINYKDYEYKQYLGVFSANHIDYATQFLLENIELRENEKTFLDIGCGNGVIGKHLMHLRSWDEAVMIDDSILATASTKINITDHKNYLVAEAYNLDSFSEGQIDLVITNPPFHFEFEVDPSIAIQLLSDSYRILSEFGRLIVVANRHLNYKSQLLKWYKEVNVMNENDKFIIYEATK